MIHRHFASLSRPSLFFYAVAMAAMIALAGCPYEGEKEEDAPKDPPKDPPRALALGEKVEYTFPADGFWHNSPYLALNGQTLYICAVQQSEGLVPIEAFRMKIEKGEYLVYNTPCIKISTPGPMRFRIEPEALRDWITDMTVVIERQD